MEIFTVDREKLATFRKFFDGQFGHLDLPSAGQGGCLYLPCMQFDGFLTAERQY
jgi:hypothetical protein